MVNRVSQQEIVQGSPTVISKDNPDAIFLKDNPNVVFTDEKGFSTGKYVTSAFTPGVSSAAIAAAAATATAGTQLQIPIIVQADVPNLADIEKIDFEEYPDPLTGVAKYKAIIKIRNSSSSKSSVAGVDARIYDPNGSTSYSFGTGTASTATTISSYTNTAIWYKAVTKYNSLTDTVYYGPSVDSSAQYAADGSNVPQDSSTGSLTNRTKVVWRKTMQEALDAAAVYTYAQ